MRPLRIGILVVIVLALACSAWAVTATKFSKVRVQQPDTTGYAFQVDRNLTAASTNSPLAYFLQDHASDDQPLLYLKQDGTGNIITALGSGGVQKFYVDTNGVLYAGYDAAAFWTATTADGGGVTFNCTSDGTAGFTFSDAVTLSAGIDIGSTITLSNDETIDNATNGQIAVTAGVFKHLVDSAAYWTATQADGAGVTFDSVSDGTAGFTFSDALSIPKATVTQTATTGNAVSITRDLASGSTDSPVLSVVQDNATDDQTALYLKQDASAAYLIDAYQGATRKFAVTANGVMAADSVVFTQATTGYAIDATRDLAAGSTDSPVVRILQDNATDDQAALYIKQDAAANLITGVGTAAATVFEVTDGGAVKSLSGVGAAAGAGNVATEYGTGYAHQTVLTLTDVSVSIADGAPGFGTLKIYDFPAGYIQSQGLVADITLTAGAGGITDDFDGDISFGTTGTADGTLDGTDVNWVASTGTTQAAAGIGAADCVITATEQTIKDGHTTASDLYVSIIIDDADISALDTLAINGTITITWMNLGDN